MLSILWTILLFLLLSSGIVFALGLLVAMLIGFNNAINLSLRKRNEKK